MSMCNFCLLRDIRRQAKNDGMKVTVLGDAVWGMGGRNVYVHPPQIDVAAIEGGEDGKRKKYFEAWMMHIPDKCEC